MLEQQLAGEPSAAANAAATQAQTTAQQLQAAIQQMSDKRVAHRLQVRVRVRCVPCSSPQQAHRVPSRDLGGPAPDRQQRNICVRV